MSKSKIIHDLNSSLSALNQSLDIICNDTKIEEKKEKIIKQLTLKKISEILKKWDELKIIIKD